MDINSILSTSSNILSIYNVLSHQAKISIDSAVSLSGHYNYRNIYNNNYLKVTAPKLIVKNTGNKALKGCVIKLERIAHSEFYLNPGFKPFKLEWYKGNYEMTLRRDEREIIPFGTINESKDLIEIATSDGINSVTLSKHHSGYYLFIFSVYTEDLKVQKVLARYKVCSSQCVHFYILDKEYYGPLEKSLTKI